MKRLMKHKQTRHYRVLNSSNGAALLPIRGGELCRVQLTFGVLFYGAMFLVALFLLSPLTANATPSASEMCHQVAVEEVVEMPLTLKR